MGYVFDALNKSDGEDGSEPHRPEQEGQCGSSSSSLSQMDQSGESPTSKPAEGVGDTGGAPDSTPWSASSQDLPEGLDERLVLISNPASLMAEEYRSIRTRLLARWQQRRHLVHVITSANPREGKTVSSLNMGFCFAEITDRRTVVLECDLRLPMFDRLLGRQSETGLIQLLQERADLDELLRPQYKPNLSIISAGGIAGDDAAQLLGTPEFAQLLDELRNRCDHIIVDTPPVLELADTGVVAGLADEVLLAIRMHRTPRHLIDQAVRTLKSYEAPLSGTILTAKRSHGSGYYNRYHYHGRYRYYHKGPYTRQSA